MVDRRLFSYLRDWAGQRVYGFIPILPVRNSLHGDNRIVWPGRRYDLALSWRGFCGISFGIAFRWSEYVYEAMWECLWSSLLGINGLRSSAFSNVVLRVYEKFMIPR
jgi:hypothetical protein